MSRSPSPIWSDWIKEDMMGDYTSTQPSEPAYSCYPTGDPRLTEESSLSHLRQPMPYQTYYFPGVSDLPPGLSPSESASSIGSGSPPSPRSLRSDSPEASDQRELPHAMEYSAEFSPAWAAPLAADEYYGTDMTAFPTDISYTMPADSSYTIAANGNADSQSNYTYAPSSSTLSSHSSTPDTSRSHSEASSSPPSSPGSGHHGGGSHKRSRHINDPNKVARVRSVGGCIVCRMGKYSCEAAHGPCDKCVKQIGAYAPTCCLRQRPSEVIGAEQIWGASLGLRIPRSGQNVDRIAVQFPCVTSVGQTRPLHLSVQRIESTTDFCLYQEHLPTENALVSWVENQMMYEYQYENSGTFQSAMERLVMEYATSHHTTSSKRHSLMKRVHTLSCMFRIWSSKTLYTNGPAGAAVELPGTVHIQLHDIAKESIRRAQREIMSEFDKSIKDIKSKDRDLPLWACLWQTLFVYMQLWDLLPQMIQNGQATEGARDRTERLVVTLGVMLAMHFKNQSPVITLKTSESDAKKSCGGDSRVFETFKNVVRARESFHQDVLMGAREGNNWCALWKQLIVETEKDLERRRKKSKGSSK
ncbi:uncharacterized protein MKZ38_008759 [Zalerion maritima]|uniref:Uncharacterized protein n=1 Tax=Zalerion maritima TaxID=339359 RepID=A0AAD5WTT6_9PEZI|nr:uncharacterized protein MKZ38_008759 [Zalerion maritima]